MLTTHMTEAGAGTVTRDGARIVLALPPVQPGSYHNAQVSSYRTRQGFTFRPPLRLRLTAQADGVLTGTAGFGFWNHPFAPGERGIRLPKAAWFFFAAPPNNMALALDVPGYGWKASTLDATRALFLALLPTALPGFLLMRSPALYRRLWPLAQHALGVSEHPLPPALLEHPHTYTLDWYPERLIFHVDGAVVHTAPYAPRGPLGFIAWVDNQFAVVTPQGRFRFGLTAAAAAQRLTITGLDIHALSAV